MPLLASPRSTVWPRARRRTTADVAIVACAACLVAAIAASGCGFGAGVIAAVGSYSDVAVLVDERALGNVARQLQSSLQIDVDYGLDTERAFKVDIFDMRDRKKAAPYKNVVVIALLKGKDRGSRELRRQMGGEHLDDWYSGQLYEGTRKNLYADNQLVVFLAGKDPREMRKAVRQTAGRLIRDLERSNRSRVLAYLLLQGHDAAGEARIAREGRFHLTVPSSYHITRAGFTDKGGGVEIAALDPTRTVAVFYVTADSSQVLDDHAALLQTRRRWGETFLQEQLQDEGGFEWSQQDFRGDSTLTLAGLWASTDGDKGGPFRTYFVYDDASHRLYALNVLVYAPGMDKQVYMREATAVAESFSPRP